MYESAHRSHPGEVDINLDSTRDDLKPLLAKLNPILQEILEALRTRPERSVDPCSGGYHNITFCEHPFDESSK